MRSEVEIDAERPDKLKDIVGLSLESGDRVEYSLDGRKDSLKTTINTESLGVLRGCTDTVFRLTTLAKKLY